MEKESSKALVNLIKSGSQMLSKLDLTNTQLPIDSLKEIMRITKGSLILAENNLSSFPGGRIYTNDNNTIAFDTMQK